jgi:uncharacterized membrane protein
MRTPASIAGHPIHPMLVPIAIGGFVLSFAFDLVSLLSGAASPNSWNNLAYYTMIGGILSALAAAVPGLIDLLSLPSEIKKTALVHMGINLLVVGIYVVNAYMRDSAPRDLTLPMFLSVVTIALLLVSGWLGGKMVFEARVGVTEPN